MIDPFRINDDGDIACVKCGSVSGDDWSQCEGPCPVPGSPHYQHGAIKTWSHKDTAAWGEKTFGRAKSNAVLAARANKEVAELLQALATDDNHPGAGEEIADIVVLMAQVAYRAGYVLQDEIDKKMLINTRREWNVDRVNGIGRHK